MKIKNKVLFDEYVKRNKDLCGVAVMDHAVRWSETIEKRMGKGIKFENIAESSLYQANTENLNRFMIAAAVEVLANTWEHGEDLGKWFKDYDNKLTGIKRPVCFEQDMDAKNLQKNKDLESLNFFSIIKKVVRHGSKQRGVYKKGVVT